MLRFLGRLLRWTLWAGLGFAALSAVVALLMLARGMGWISN